MNKVLALVYLPLLEEEYDVFLPINKQLKIKNDYFSGLLFMPLTHATTSLGTVSEAQNKDSVQEGTKAVINGADSAKVTITYDAANLKIVAADETAGRENEAAWVGFIITTPTDASGKTNKVKINGVEYEADKDGAYYFAITKDKLDKGEPIVYTCEFDWNYEESTFTTDQIVTITIDPAVVKLISKESNDVVYDGPAIAEAKKQEAQKQEENKENTENSNDNTKNPNTSDAIICSVIAITISAIGLAFTYKKLHNN